MSRYCYDQIIEKLNNMAEKIAFEKGVSEGKAKARAEILDNIHEIYKYQLYCKEEYCDKEEPTASNCVDCFYDAIMRVIERGQV